MWCSVTLGLGWGLAGLGQQLGSMTLEGFSNLEDPVVLKNLGPSSSNTEPGCWQNEVGHKHQRSLTHRDTVTCREGLVLRQQPVAPSLPGALCAPLGVDTCLGVSLRGTRSSIYQLRGLQALGLCSCSALSQGGRDVTLPGTLLASDPCCFLPYLIWIYQQSSVFSLKLSLG